MAEVNYAFIKNGEVVNVAVFEDPTDAQLLAHFKDKFSLDNIVKATDKTVIGGTYDGTKFWLPKPYPSWVKDNETNEWVAPVAAPAFDEEDPKYYTWDEDSTSWVEVVPAL
jgi:hypothetical protein